MIYYANYRVYYPIFGDNFVKENKDNIDLLVNGKKNEFADKCLLIKGENIITMVIKNKLTDLSRVFKNCRYLKDFSELKYLDVKEIPYMDTSATFSSVIDLNDNFSYIKKDLSDIYTVEIIDYPEGYNKEDEQLEQLNLFE